VFGYSDGQNPYGFVTLDSTLTSQQPYTITLTLDLPRTPGNVHGGNFMLDISLLSPSYKPAAQDTTLPFANRGSIPPEAILFTSRRPTIMTYHSPLIGLSKQIAALPWYIFGWRKDSERLVVEMADSVQFPRGWRNIPGSVYVEVQGRGQDIQVYDIQLKLHAKFWGLRWIMYNHRIFSFVVGTGAFWTAEVIVALFTWVIWGTQSSPNKLDKKNAVKGEETDGSAAVKLEGEAESDDPDLSDTPRNFPTYGRQVPLRYEPKIKHEEDGEDLIIDETTVQPLAGEADDESEEPMDVGSAFRAGRSDSGIGTSFSEGGSMGGTLGRRKSKGKGGG
jgi:seipin